MIQKYIGAIQIVDQLNCFFKEFDLDLKYIELIVLYWFKIKQHCSKCFSNINCNKEKKVYEEMLYPHYGYISLLK
jgi:hypothetical protein